MRRKIFRVAKGNRGPTSKLLCKAMRKVISVRARRSQLIKPSELALAFYFNRLREVCLSRLEE